MSYYLIKYLDSNGNKHHKEVESSSKLNAIDNSKIDPNSILSVSRSIAFGRRDLSLDVQELIISEIRALAYSGQALHQGLIDILQRANIKRKISIQDVTDDGNTISNILATVGVSKIIAALIASGESSGRLQASLDSALLYIQSQKKILAKVKAPFTQGLIVISLAFTIMMFLPKIIAPALDNLTSSSLSIDTNVVTDILIFIYKNNNSIWLVILSTITTIFLLRKIIWVKVRRLPLLRLLDDFFILRRSTLLLMIFKPLFESNISLNKTLTIIKSSMSSDTDTKAVQELLDKMNNGEKLSSAIRDPNYWAPAFYNSFASFEKSILSAQLDLINTVTFALISRLTITSTRISSVANFTGKIIGFLSLFMIIIGYYFPSLTANV